MNNLHIKRNFTRLLFSAVLMMCCMVMNAQSFTVDDIAYNVTGENTVEVAGNESQFSGSVVIPATVTNPNDSKTYSVRGIGNAAFYDCIALTSVTIPETVTSIGNDAFWNCTSLTSISLQEGVTSIGTYAFHNCSGIKEGVVIPSTVTTTGSFAFDECKSLPSVTIKGGSIGDDAFSGCTGLTSISLHEGVTSIGNFVFEGCSNIKGDLVIPSTVTNIGHHAFYYLEKLSSVTVKGGSLGDYAFSGCTGLTSISLHEGVTSIGNFAFDGCSNIKEDLVIPSTVKSIGNFAFNGCTGITSMSFQEGVTTIGNSAFNGCYGMKQDLTIPSTVTTIGDAAFYVCTGLTSISLQEGVTTIGDDAFYGCYGIKENLDIPSTVTSIGGRAFADCTGLTSIYVFPSTLPSLGEDAFENIDKSIPVYVPDAKEYAEWGGFANIRLINFFKLNGEKCWLDEDGEIDELEFADKDAFQSYRDFTANELTYSRTFANTDWQPLYVPFAMSYYEWKEDFDVAAINNFHEYTDLDGNMCKAELEVRLVKSGTLKPNHPYLICAKRADASNPQRIDFSSKEICKSDVNSIVCSSVERKYTFTGTYKEMTGLKTNEYIFLSNGKLCKATSDDEKLDAQRWYLSIESLGSQIIEDDESGSAVAKAFSFDIKLLDDETTGIDEITVTRTPLKNSDEATYTLNGMRVNDNYKGIVIKNGKKIYQK